MLDRHITPNLVELFIDEIMGFDKTLLCGCVRRFPPSVDSTNTLTHTYARASVGKEPQI